jgi:hypothetical protein
MGVSGPRVEAITSQPPGAVTRPELFEEGDHVHEDEQVEGSVFEGERVRVGDLEAHAVGQLVGQQVVCLSDHPW